MMGYILDGEYFNETPDVPRLRNRQQSTYRQSEHNRQRKDYAREIIQPHNRDGSPNEQFIEAFPVESKELYNFLPSDEEIMKGQ